MNPYYIQPGTPVYLKIIVTTHSALTYDDTPEAVTPSPLPTPTISFDELISQGR